VVIVGVLSAQSVCCSHFIDHYAVHIDGGVSAAKRIAHEHGFLYVNEVGL